MTENLGISGILRLGTPISWGFIFLVEKCVNDNLHELYVILCLCPGPFANVEA